MSNRSRPTLLAALALTAAAALAAARAADAPRSRLVQRVYSVADLVVPIRDYAACGRPRDVVQPLGLQEAGPGGKAIILPQPASCMGEPSPGAQPLHDVLMRLITATVAPESWADAGGVGTIDYQPIGMALVVNHRPDVQERVAELLDALRRLQDVQVALEVKAVTVSDLMYEQMQTCAAGGWQPFMTEQQVGQLIQCAQGDRQTSVLAAPKVTAFNGQEVSVCAMDERFFVTGLQCLYAAGQPAYVPRNEPIATGFQMTVRPTVTPDRKSVLLMLDAELRELADDQTPLFPVTTFVTPVFEGGAQGRPVPFTQFIQQPTVVSRGLTKVMGIPDGQTAVLYAGRATHTHRGSTSAPVLGDIPFVGELFKTPTAHTSADHLLLLVTPRVIVAAEAAPPTVETVTAIPRCVGAVGEEQAVRAAAPPQACPPPPVAAASPEPQIRLDACLLSVDPAYFDRPDAAAWADLSAKACAGQPKVLAAEEGARFAKAVRRQKGGKLLAQPKIVTLNGRPATFLTGGQTAWATGIDFDTDAAKPQFRTTTVAYGTQLELLPEASADGQSVRLRLKAEVSQPAAVQPVGYRVTIAAEDDPTGESARTETIRRPVMSVSQVETTLAIPAGRTALFHLGANGPDQQPLIVLLTPSVVRPCAAPCPQAAVAPCPEMPHSPVMCQPEPAAEEQAAPPAEPTLASLLSQYRRACAAGDTAAARKLAQRCLILDPTCFGR